MRHGPGITGRLVGFVLLVVIATYALRWAYEQLQPMLPVLIVVIVAIGLWRVSSLIRRW